MTDVSERMIHRTSSQNEDNESLSCNVSRYRFQLLLLVTISVAVIVTITGSSVAISYIVNGNINSNNVHSSRILKNGYERKNYEACNGTSFKLSSSVHFNVCCIHHGTSNLKIKFTISQSTAKRYVELSLTEWKRLLTHMSLIRQEVSFQKKTECKKTLRPFESQRVKP